MKKQFFSIIFIIIGILTILEFLFIQGMFTGPFMLFLVAISGIINFVLEVKDRNYIYSVIYLISTAGLSMGYINIML